MIIVNAVMLPLAMGVKRLLAMDHFIMPPAMSKVVSERPGTPPRRYIRANGKQIHGLTLVYYASLLGANFNI